MPRRNFGKPAEEFNSQRKIWSRKRGTFLNVMPAKSKIKELLTRQSKYINPDLFRVFFVPKLASLLEKATQNIEDIIKKNTGEITPREKEAIENSKWLIKMVYDMTQKSINKDSVSQEVEIIFEEKKAKGQEKIIEGTHDNQHV